MAQMPDTIDVELRITTLMPLSRLRLRFAAQLIRIAAWIIGDTAPVVIDIETGASRPDWAAIYGIAAAPSDNDLIVLTRESARLAENVMRTQLHVDAYHNFAAAHREIVAALRGD